eukprot:9952595-Alexandrium_andersonii.AAC.1
MPRGWAGCTLRRRSWHPWRPCPNVSLNTSEFGEFRSLETGLLCGTPVRASDLRFGGPCQMPG